MDDPGEADGPHQDQFAPILSGEVGGVGPAAEGGLEVGGGAAVGRGHEALEHFPVARPDHPPRQETAGQVIHGNP